MSFAFAPPRPRRRPSLTPMIDVVFLLLVFFMLVSRFGHDRALPIAAGGAGGDYSGPPRMVEVLPDGLRLNGQPIAAEALADALRGLTGTPEDAIVLIPAEGADLQRLAGTLAALQDAGFARLIVAEGR